MPRAQGGHVRCDAADQPGARRPPTFAAQNAGAGNLDRIRYGYRTTNYLAAGIGICLSILVVSNREFLMSLFVSTKDYPVLAPGDHRHRDADDGHHALLLCGLALIHSC